MSVAYVCFFTLLSIQYAFVIVNYFIGVIIIVVIVHSSRNVQRQTHIRMIVPFFCLSFRSFLRLSPYLTSWSFWCILMTFNMKDSQIEATPNWYALIFYNCCWQGARCQMEIVTETLRRFESFVNKCRVDWWVVVNILEDLVAAIFRI